MKKNLLIRVARRMGRMLKRKSSHSSQPGVVFLHIPKTGGTTFRNVLIEMYEGSYIYCRDPRVRPIKSLLKKYRCVEFHVMHYKDRHIYLHQEIIRPSNWKYLNDSLIFIMFRNPVDRMISNYYELERKRAKEGKEGKSLESYLKSNGGNNQLRFLLGYHPTSKYIPDRNDLEHAKKMILELKMNVGILERYSDSLRLLEHATGKEVTVSSIPVRNRTDPDLLSVVDEKQRKEIASLNMLDQQLYEFGLEVFQNQLSKLQDSNKKKFEFSFDQRRDIPDKTEKPKVETLLPVEDISRHWREALKRETKEEFIKALRSEQGYDFDNSIAVSYLICCLPRTGSSLLCDLLRQIEVAGRPREYFLPWQQALTKPSRIDSSRQEWLISPGTYFERIRATATRNRVLGIKSMYQHFDMISIYLNELLGETTFEVFNQVFPRLRYIYLTREDKVRQAISKAKARQTGMYILPGSVASNSLQAKNVAKPEYSFELIHECYTSIIDKERQWENYFSGNGISPYRITYETFLSSFEFTITGILDYLGIRYPENFKVPAPNLVRQTDGVNDQWFEQYCYDLKKQNAI